MSPIIFDGKQFALQREAMLKTAVGEVVANGFQPAITAILFIEDSGSRLYTQLKREAAERVGIKYHIATFSLLDPVETVLEQLQVLNADPQVTGIIIQKPWRKTWLFAHDMATTPEATAAFNTWWHSLTSEIATNKDVDGLHPATLQAIKDGTWQSQGKVLPATVKAVLTIFEEAKKNVALPEPSHTKIIVLGKSDILGKPLTWELRNQGYQVEMIGSAELQARIEAGVALTDADVVVSSTGHKHLVTGELIKTGAIVIDVGEPKPDVEFSSVSPKVAFMTPVPGGVGPLTVISLLENGVQLMKNHSNISMR